MTPIDAVLVFAAIGMQGALIVMVGLGIIAMITLPLWLLFGGLRAVVAIWVGQATPSTKGASAEAAGRSSRRLRDTRDGRSAPVASAALA